jgi:hypothetical protein
MFYRSLRTFGIAFTLIAVLGLILLSGRRVYTEWCIRAIRTNGGDLTWDPDRQVMTLIWPSPSGKRVRAGSAFRLSKVVDRWPLINALSLEGQQVTLENVNTLTNSVLRENLIQFEIADAPAICDELIMQLDRFPRLQRFTVCDYEHRLTGTGVNGLAGAPELRELNLWSALNLEFDMGRLLRVCPRLESLVVLGGRISDGSLAGIRDNGHLRTLVLGSQMVTDQGIGQLVHLRALTNLTLSNMPQVTDMSIDSLASMSHLKSLVVQGCGLTSAGQVRLREKMPGCEVK